ncbi:MAG: DUF2997 domain-containing protein [Nocardioidaceae bacterium]
MSEQYIEVRIAADGTVTAETHNIMGSSCLDYIAILENLLAAETVTSEYTADFAGVQAVQDSQDVAPATVRQDNEGA